MLLLCNEKCSSSEICVSMNIKTKPLGIPLLLIKINSLYNWFHIRGLVHLWLFVAICPRSYTIVIINASYRYFHLSGTYFLIKYIDTFCR